tara:strand:+ start:12184 stop:18405 length:6222 start_codon:yes stop_codon:yes gene_type:complete
MKYSKNGYKRNSKDVNNPYNLIDSGDITMEGVDFPVMGIDNLGNSQLMMPGANYQFPGNTVFEVPLAQKGFEVPKRKGVRKNPDGTESTHLMRTETLDGENWFSFPSLFQDEDGTWIDMSEEEDWMPVYEEAKRRGEVIDFGTDKEAAIKFGEGSWKPKMQSGGARKPIAVTDPNDPKLQAYKDSLTLNEFGKAQYELENNYPSYFNIFSDAYAKAEKDPRHHTLNDMANRAVKNNPRISWSLNRPASSSYKYTIKGNEDWIKKPLNPWTEGIATITSDDQTYQGVAYKRRPNEKAQLKKGDVIEFSKYSVNTGMYDRLKNNKGVSPVIEPSSPDLDHETIKPVGSYSGRGANDIWPKPIQPYYYKKPQLSIDQSFIPNVLEDQPFGIIKPKGTTDPNISVDVRFRKMGMDPSFANRKKIALQMGMESYSGTSEQNKQLNLYVQNNYTPDGEKIIKEEHTAVGSTPQITAPNIVEPETISTEIYEKPTTKKGFIPIYGNKSFANPKGEIVGYENIYTGGFELVENYNARNARESLDKKQVGEEVEFAPGILELPEMQAIAPLYERKRVNRYYDDEGNFIKQTDYDPDTSEEEMAGKYKSKVTEWINDYNKGIIRSSADVYSNKYPSMLEGSKYLFDQAQNLVNTPGGRYLKSIGTSEIIENPELLDLNRIDKLRNYIYNAQAYNNKINEYDEAVESMNTIDPKTGKPLMSTSKFERLYKRKNWDQVDPNVVNLTPEQQEEARSEFYGKNYTEGNTWVDNIKDIQSIPGDVNTQITNIRKAINRRTGVYDPSLSEGTGLTLKDTVFNLGDYKVKYDKNYDNIYPEGSTLLGGDFIVWADPSDPMSNPINFPTNHPRNISGYSSSSTDEYGYTPSVRTAEQWLGSSSTEPYGDVYNKGNFDGKRRRRTVGDVVSFYGVEDGKFKVGSADEFKSDTEIIPNRFDEGKAIASAKIDKESISKDYQSSYDFYSQFPWFQKLSEKQKQKSLEEDGDKKYAEPFVMYDSEGKSFGNFGNIGSTHNKIILYSKDTGESVFIAGTKEKLNEETNKFLKNNTNVIPVILDTGRFSEYSTGTGEEGKLTKDDYKNYYDLDWGGSDDPGYNIILDKKQDGGEDIQDLSEVTVPAYYTARELVKSGKMDTNVFDNLYRRYNWAKYDPKNVTNEYYDQGELERDWYGGYNPVDIANKVPSFLLAGAAGPFAIGAATPVVATALANPAVQAGLTAYGGYDAATNTIPATYNALQEGRYLDAAGNAALTGLNLAPIPAFGKNLLKGYNPVKGSANQHIKNLQKEGLLPKNLSKNQIKILNENPNLLDLATGRGIKDALTVTRSTTPNINYGRSSSGTQTPISNLDLNAFKKFGLLEDEAGQAMYSASHVPGMKYGYRDGLDRLPYETRLVKGKQQGTPTSLDALYTYPQSSGAPKKVLEGTFDDAYGNYATILRHPFDYSGSSYDMLNKFKKFQEAAFSKGKSLLKTKGADAVAGDIGVLNDAGKFTSPSKFWHPWSSAYGEMPFVGHPGQKLLQPVATYTKPRVNELQNEIETLRNFYNFTGKDKTSDEAMKVIINNLNKRIKSGNFGSPKSNIESLKKAAKTGDTPEFDISNRDVSNRSSLNVFMSDAFDPKTGLIKDKGNLKEIAREALTDYAGWVNWVEKNEAFRDPTNVVKTSFTPFKHKFKYGGAKEVNKKQTGGDIYSYKYRPEMEYRKKGEGWQIKGDKTNGWVTIKEKSRIDELNKNAKLKEVFNRANIEKYLVNSRGRDKDFWQATADSIAFHESGHQQRMDPKAIQILKDGSYSGPGRGMFQFESKASKGSGSLETAQQRYQNIVKVLKKKNIGDFALDQDILDAKDARDLTEDQQYALFYANLIEGDVVLKDYADGKIPLVDVWLKGHKLKEDKNKDRGAFAESLRAAKKDGIPRKKKGGEFKTKVKRLKQQLQKFKDGEEISPMAYEKLVALKLIKPEEKGTELSNGEIKEDVPSKELTFADVEIDKVIKGKFNPKKEFIDEEKMSEKLIYKSGGEFGTDQQEKFYEEYIEGVFNNTEEEERAKKLFDKLNRIYYKDAKENNMHQLDIIKSINRQG